jgi:hypothetical protein
MLHYGIRVIDSTLDLYGIEFNKSCRTPVLTLSLHGLSFFLRQNSDWKVAEFGNLAWP